MAWLSSEQYLVIIILLSTNRTSFHVNILRNCREGRNVWRVVVGVGVVLKAIH